MLRQYLLPVNCRNGIQWLKPAEFAVNSCESFLLLLLLMPLLRLLPRLSSACKVTAS